MYILSFLNRKENFQNSFKGSLRSRRKRGRGKEAKTWEKNGGLGASPTPSPPFKGYFKGNFIYASQIPPGLKYKTCT